MHHLQKECCLQEGCYKDWSAVNGSTAFINNVGIDYAGPVIAKRGHAQLLILQKTYICVFVCMAIKVVHLEAVSDLTSEAIISALIIFISRRGKPSQILSDNVTNFVGANNYLKEVYKFLAAKATQDQVIELTTSQQITWSFIPEHSPHFGGICECNKVCKISLEVYFR